MSSAKRNKKKEALKTGAQISAHTLHKFAMGTSFMSRVVRYFVNLGQAEAIDDEFASSRADFESLGDIRNQPTTKRATGFSHMSHRSGFVMLQEKMLVNTLVLFSRHFASTNPAEFRKLLQQRAAYMSETLETGHDLYNVDNDRFDHYGNLISRRHHDNEVLNASANHPRVNLGDNDGNTDVLVTKDFAVNDLDPHDFLDVSQKHTLHNPSHHKGITTSTSRLKTSHNNNDNNGLTSPTFLISPENRHNTHNNHLKGTASLHSHHNSAGHRYNVLRSTPEHGVGTLIPTMNIKHQVYKYKYHRNHHTLQQLHNRALLNAAPTDTNKISDVFDQNESNLDPNLPDPGPDSHSFLHNRMDLFEHPLTPQKILSNHENDKTFPQKSLSELQHEIRAKHWDALTGKSVSNQLHDEGFINHNTPSDQLNTNQPLSLKKHLKTAAPKVSVVSSRMNKIICNQSGLPFRQLSRGMASSSRNNYHDDNENDLNTPHHTQYHNIHRAKNLHDDFPNDLSDIPDPMIRFKHYTHQNFDNSPNIHNTTTTTQPPRHIDGLDHINPETPMTKTKMPRVDASDNVVDDTDFVSNTRSFYNEYGKHRMEVENHVKHQQLLQREQKRTREQLEQNNVIYDDMNTPHRQIDYDSITDAQKKEYEELQREIAERMNEQQLAQKSLLFSPQKRKALRELALGKLSHILGTSALNIKTHDHVFGKLLTSLSVIKNAHKNNSYDIENNIENMRLLSIYHNRNKSSETFNALSNDEKNKLNNILLLMKYKNNVSKLNNLINDNISEYREKSKFFNQLYTNLDSNINKLRSKRTILQQQKSTAENNIESTSNNLISADNENSNNPRLQLYHMKDAIDGEIHALTKQIGHYHSLKHKIRGKYRDYTHAVAISQQEFIDKHTLDLKKIYSIEELKFKATRNSPLLLLKDKFSLYHQNYKILQRKRFENDFQNINSLIAKQDELYSKLSDIRRNLYNGGDNNTSVDDNSGAENPITDVSPDDDGEKDGKKVNKKKVTKNNAKTSSNDPIAAQDDPDTELKKLRSLTEYEQEHYAKQKAVQKSDQEWNRLFQSVPVEHRPLLAQKWFRDVLRATGLKEGIDANFPTAEEQYKQTLAKLRQYERDGVKTDPSTISPVPNKNHKSRGIAGFTARRRHNLAVLRNSLAKLRHDTTSAILHSLQPLNDAYVGFQTRRHERWLNDNISPEERQRRSRIQRDDYNPFDPNSRFPDLPPEYIRYEMRKVFSEYLPTIARLKIIEIRNRLRTNADKLIEQNDMGIYSDTRELIALFHSTRKATRIEGLAWMCTPQDNALNAVRLIDRALGFTALYKQGPFYDYSHAKRFSPIGEHVQELLKHVHRLPVNQSLNADLSIYIDLLQNWQPPPGHKIHPELQRLQRQSQFIRLDIDYPSVKVTVDLHDRLKLYRGERRFMRYLLSQSNDDIFNFSTLANVPPHRLVFRVKYLSLDAEEKLLDHYRAKDMEDNAFVRALEERNFEKKMKLFEDDMVDEMYTAIMKFDDLNTRDGYTDFITSPYTSPKDSKGKGMLSIDRGLGTKSSAFHKRWNSRAKRLNRWLQLRQSQYAITMRKLENQRERRLQNQFKEQVRSDAEKQKLLGESDSHDTSITGRILALKDKMRVAEGASLLLKRTIEFTGDLYFYSTNKYRRGKNYAHWTVRRLDNHIKDVYRTDHPIWQGRYKPANTQIRLMRSYYLNIDPYIHFFKYYWLPNRQYNMHHVFLPRAKSLSETLFTVVGRKRWREDPVRTADIGVAMGQSGQPFQAHGTKITKIPTIYDLKTGELIKHPSFLQRAQHQFHHRLLDLELKSKLHRQYQQQYFKIQTTYLKSLAQIKLQSIHSDMLRRRMARFNQINNVTSDPTLESTPVTSMDAKSISSSTYLKNNFIFNKFAKILPILTPNYLKNQPSTLRTDNDDDNEGNVRRPSVSQLNINDIQQHKYLIDNELQQYEHLKKHINDEFKQFNLSLQDYEYKQSLQLKQFTKDSIPYIKNIEDLTPQQIKEHYENLSQTVMVDHMYHNVKSLQKDLYTAIDNPIDLHNAIHRDITMGQTTTDELKALNTLDLKDPSVVKNLPIEKRLLVQQQEMRNSIKNLEKIYPNETPFQRFTRQQTMLRHNYQSKLQLLKLQQEVVAQSQMTDVMSNIEDIKHKQRILSSEYSLENDKFLGDVDALQPYQQSQFSGEKLHNHLKQPATYRSTPDIVEVKHIKPVGGESPQQQQLKRQQHPTQPKDYIDPQLAQKIINESAPQDPVWGSYGKSTIIKSFLFGRKTAPLNQLREFETEQDKQFINDNQLKQATLVARIAALKKQMDDDISLSVDDRVELLEQQHDLQKDLIQEKLELEKFRHSQHVELQRVLRRREYEQNKQHEEVNRVTQGPSNGRGQVFETKMGPGGGTGVGIDKKSSRFGKQLNAIWNKTKSNTLKVIGAPQFVRSRISTLTSKIIPKSFRKFNNAQYEPRFKTIEELRAFRQHQQMELLQFNAKATGFGADPFQRESTSLFDTNHPDTLSQASQRLIKPTMHQRFKDKVAAAYRRAKHRIINNPTIRDYEVVLEPILNARNKGRAAWRYRRLVFAVTKHFTHNFIPGGKNIVTLSSRALQHPLIKYPLKMAQGIMRFTGRFISRRFEKREVKYAKFYSPRMRKEYMESDKRSHVMETAIRAKLLLRAYFEGFKHVFKATVGMQFAVWLANINDTKFQHRYAAQARQYMRRYEQAGYINEPERPRKSLEELIPGASTHHLRRDWRTTRNSLIEHWHNWKRFIRNKQRHRIRAIRKGRDPVLHNHFVPPHIRLLGAAWMMFRGYRYQFAEMWRKFLYIALFWIFSVHTARKWFKHADGSQLGIDIGENSEKFLNASVWHILFSHSLVTTRTDGDSDHQAALNDAKMTQFLLHTMKQTWGARQEAQTELLRRLVSLPDRNHDYPGFKWGAELVWKEFMNEFPLYSPVQTIQEKLYDPVRRIFQGVFHNEYESSMHFWNESKVIDSAVRDRTPAELWDRRINRFSLNRIRWALDLFRSGHFFHNTAMLWYPFVDNPMDPAQVEEFFVRATDPELAKKNRFGDSFYIPITLFRKLYIGLNPYRKDPRNGRKKRRNYTKKIWKRGFKPHDYYKKRHFPYWRNFDGQFPFKPKTLHSFQGDGHGRRYRRNRLIFSDQAAILLGQVMRAHGRTFLENLPMQLQITKVRSRLEAERDILVELAKKEREIAGNEKEANKILQKADGLTFKIATLDILAAHDIVIIKGEPYIGLDPLEDRAFKYTHKFKKPLSATDEEQDDAWWKKHQWEHAGIPGLLTLNGGKVLEMAKDPHFHAYVRDIGFGRRAHSDRVDPIYNVYDEPEEFQLLTADQLTENQIYEMTAQGRKMYVPIKHNRMMEFVPAFRIALGTWLYDYLDYREKLKGLFPGPSKPDPEVADNPENQYWRPDRSATDWMINWVKWSMLPIRLVNSRGNYKYPHEWTVVKNAMKQLLIRDFPFDPIVDHDKIKLCPPHPDQWEDRLERPNEFFKGDFINILRQLDATFYGQPEPYVDYDVLRLFFEYARSRVMNVVTTSDDQFIRLVDNLIFSNYVDPIEHDQQFVDEYNDVWNKLWMHSPALKESLTPDPGDLLEGAHALPTERIKRLINTPPQDLTQFDIDDGNYLNALFEDYVEYLKETIADEYKRDMYYFEIHDYRNTTGLSRRYNDQQIEAQLDYLDETAKQFADALPIAQQYGQGYDKRPYNLQLIETVINVGYRNKFHRPRPQLWWDPVVVPFEHNILPSDLGHYGVPDHIISPEWDPLNGVFFTDIFSKAPDYPLRESTHSELSYSANPFQRAKYWREQNKRTKLDIRRRKLWNAPVARDLILMRKIPGESDPAFRHPTMGDSKSLDEPKKRFKDPDLSSVDPNIDKDWWDWKHRKTRELLNPRFKSLGVKNWWHPWSPQVGDSDGDHVDHDGMPKDGGAYFLDWDHRDDQLRPYIHDMPWTRPNPAQEHHGNTLQTFFAMRYPKVFNPHIPGPHSMIEDLADEDDVSLKSLTKNWTKSTRNSDDTMQWHKKRMRKQLTGKYKSPLRPVRKWVAGRGTKTITQNWKRKSSGIRKNLAWKMSNYTYHKTEYTPSWYELLGIDQEYIVDMAFKYYYSSTMFDPLRDDKVPDWSTLDINKYAIREFLQRSYPDDYHFKEWLEGRFNEKYQWAKDNLPEHDVQVYTKILDAEWQQSLDRFQKIKDAYEKLYWHGPKDGRLDNGLDIPPDLEDWYFNEVTQQRFGKEFLRPYWTQKRLLDYRKRVFLEEHIRLDKYAILNKGQEVYTKKMDDVEKKVETKYYYLLPEQYTKMLDTTETLVKGDMMTNHLREPSMATFPKKWTKMINDEDIYETDLRAIQEELQRVRTWEKSPKLYERVYGRDKWMNQHLVDRWMEMYAQAHQDDMDEEQAELAIYAREIGDVSILPLLPITHEVLQRNPTTGQLEVQDHDKPIFERFGTHVYMQNKHDLHWARKHVRDVWADVVERAISDASEPMKFELDAGDFEWKNRGLEMAMLDLYIAELKQRMTDIRFIISENQAKIQSLIDDTQTIQDAAHSDDVIRNLEREAAHLSRLMLPVNNALIIYETQKKIYDPLNLALYQRYLRNLQKEQLWDKLNEEYLHFQNYVQVHWHRLPHPVGGYAKLNRNMDNFLPVFGASQLPPITTVETLNRQLQDYLYKGKPFLLAYHDLRPGVISTMEPNFVLDPQTERWVVEVPPGFEFINGELSLTTHRARIAEDLYWTLAKLKEHDKILNINQFKARGEIMIARRIMNFNKRFDNTHGLTLTPQKRPPFFHEEYYDKSIKHERMINAMDWYDTHYFTTLVHLELAESGKKYMVPPPGRPWKGVKDRLRRYWRQNYPHFAWMYWKNYSISKTPGQILFYLEEYYRIHNFDLAMFHGKPFQYHPIKTDYDLVVEQEQLLTYDILHAVADLAREQKMDTLKDMMMDEIANISDVALHNTRPLYKTPLLSFEGDGNQYALPLGTNLPLNEAVRADAERQLEQEKIQMWPLMENLYQQKHGARLGRDIGGNLVGSSTDPNASKKYSPREDKRRHNFYSNLRTLHNLETPYQHYITDHVKKKDFISAIDESVHSEFF